MSSKRAAVVVVEVVEVVAVVVKSGSCACTGKLNSAADQSMQPIDQTT